MIFDAQRNFSMVIEFLKCLEYRQSVRVRRRLAMIIDETRISPATCCNHQHLFKASRSGMSGRRLHSYVVMVCSPNLCMLVWVMFNMYFVDTASLACFDELRLQGEWSRL
jgi:hypothetical protein